MQYLRKQLFLTPDDAMPYSTQSNRVEEIIYVSYNADILIVSTVFRNDFAETYYKHL